MKAVHPDIPVRWAYTSHIIREKLAKQGKDLDSPEAALSKMMDEKFTHVAVQTPSEGRSITTCDGLWGPLP